MGHVWKLALLLLGAFALTQARDGEPYLTLTPDWATGWGSWGPKEFCPPGTFAYAFRINVEAPLGEGDDTAMNGIQLLCRSAQDTPDGDNIGITSTVQSYGVWGRERRCSSGFLTGMRLSVEVHRCDGDDTAANDLEMRCGWSHETHSGGGTEWGDWGLWENCPQNWAICGLQTRVESDQRGGDDTALNSVRMFCCSMDGSNMIS